MNVHVDRGYVTDLLADLVRINSVNPAFTDGRTDEREIGWYLVDVLTHVGLDVSTREPETGRLSVIGRYDSGTPGPRVILYAHVDTVGVEEMAAPFSAELREGRLYGRGAYDMKGGLTACVAAAKVLAQMERPTRGEVLVTAVADEEVASIGMADVLEQVRADAAIVTEPTELDVCIAHKGFCWIEVETYGHAAHGSRFDLGVDANMRMGRFLARLDRLERELRLSTGHGLVGPPSLHAPIIRGGSGPSTYAAKCRLEIERRTIPGENEALAMGEVQDIVRILQEEDPTFDAHVRKLIARAPFEISRDTRIVQTIRQAAGMVLGGEPTIVGAPYWMDAALLQAAGIETVVMGPIGEGAHAVEEWVDVESVAALAEILVHAVLAYCEEI